ncbi:MAG: hypothetical protein AAGE94_15785 [Acidobacteriota bacterium]
MRLDRLSEASCLALLLVLLCASITFAAPPTFTVGDEPFLCDFNDLESALDAVPDGAHIQLSVGTYVVDHLTRHESVRISGGHDGCGGAQLPGVRSILDADKVGQILDIGAFDPIWVVLDQLDFRNGRGTPFASSPAPASGAGLRTLGPVQLLVDDVIFRNHRAQLGSAIDLVRTDRGAADAVIRNSRFYWNSSTSPVFGVARGGAVACRGGQLTIRDSTFIGNFADDEGGAVYLETCDVTIVDTRFDRSRTLGRGGAIGLVESGANLFGVISERSTANDFGSFLSAFSGAGRDVEIASSVVTQGGGGNQVFTSTDSKVRVLSSTFYDNPSAQPVLDLDDAESHVSHVIFSGNGGPPTQQDPDVFTCNLVDGPGPVPANSQNTVFGDPLFVAGDFHLQANAGSPAVDACPFGLYEAAVEDIDGDPRPDAEGMNDIGADEVR